MNAASPEILTTSISTALTRIQPSSTPEEIQAAVQEAQECLQALGASLVQLDEQNRQENARLRQDLEGVTLAKSKFVSVVTHELRIPMTSIKGYTDLLRTGVVGPVNEQQLSFLNIIRNNVERMSALVADLSDISHIDSGRMRLDYSILPIQYYVDEVVDTLRLKFDEKKQTLQVDIPDDCPPIHADKNRFMQILTNLLSNANRYTPENGKILVRAFPVEKSMRIEVSDTGIGIDPKDQERVFDQFFRSEDPVVREQPGWGLGLAVVKKLVEIMGGEIGVNSVYQEGSTFWVLLPTQFVQ